MIPYGHQTLDQSDIDEVVKVLQSDWLTQGPAVEAFESQLSVYCGARYGVAVSSGTAGLHAAYAAVGLTTGDEVIMPANTFAATANAALYRGAKPVFCDIRLDTYNLDETKLAALITPRTKAIVPVHFAGQPADLTAIMAIAKQHNLAVIEDACHALGGSYQGKKIGSLADLTVFSFHPVKSITTGEGGLVCTNNENYYEKMKVFRTHGITKERKELMQYDGPWYHEMQHLGFNYRLTDLQCALGISQLKRLDDFIKRRRIIARFYEENLKSIPGVIIPTEIEPNTSAWHLYVIRVPREHRKKIFEQLQAAGIGVQVHYIPVYHHPYYQQLGYGQTILEKTEEYYHSCISLPIYPNLTVAEQEFIITELRRIMAVLV